MNDDSATRGAAADAIRRYWPMIYAPTALFSMGEGAIVPVLPMIATDLGATLAAAALVAACLIVGQLCGNLPAGLLVERAGERRAMVVASVIALVGVAAMYAAPHLAVLGIATFLIGMCAAVFHIARHTFMTARVPYSHRARALALVGGSFRLGAFTGPAIAAGLIWWTGQDRSTIIFFGVCLVGVGLLVAFGPDPEEKALAAEREARARGVDHGFADTGEPITGGIPTGARAGLFRTMWDHRVVLARLGVAGAMLSAVRTGRQTILPLWGLSIGLDSANVALIIGAAGAIEFSLFYASGQVMDRFGRVWTTVPAQFLMGASFLALSLTHELTTASMWFGALAIAVGVGNGLSSGALLTLGSDLAPRANTPQFLGAWRTITDCGGAGAPLLVSAVTALATLSVATGAVGMIGVLGGLAFLRWVPRFLPHPR